MADLKPEDLRVSRAIKGIPYVPRDAEPLVESALHRRRVLIVGPAMSGKTRLAGEVARRLYPEHSFVVPQDGHSLRQLLADGPTGAASVVWLDDLDLLLGDGTVTRQVLDQHHARGNVLVATIGSGAYERLRPVGEQRRIGWELPGWFGEPVRLSSWSSAEYGRASDLGVRPESLAAARGHGLSASVGGGPTLLQWLRAGRETQPVGYALTRAAADWQRVGLSGAIPGSALEGLMPAYLAAVPGAGSLHELRKGLAWATTRLNTVALLNKRGDGYRLLGYAADYLLSQDSPVPEQLWLAAAAHAGPCELVGLGYQAATRYQRVDIATAVYGRAAESGHPAGASGGAFNLGSLCLQIGDLGGAATSFRRTLNSGHPDYAPAAAIKLGSILEGNLDAIGAAHAYQFGIDSGHPEHAPAAALKLGELHLNGGDPAVAATAFQFVIDSGLPGAARGAFNLASLHRRAGDRDASANAFQLAVDSGCPEVAPMAAGQLALLLHQRGDLDGAVTFYQVAIDAKDEKQSPIAAYNLGSLLQDRGDDEAAARVFQLSIDSGRADAAPAAAVRLGQLREELGDLDGAAALFQLAIDSEHVGHAPHAAVCLGHVRDRQGDLRGAVSAYELAVASGHPDHAPGAAVSLGSGRCDLGDMHGAAAAFQFAIDSEHTDHAALAAALLGILRHDELGDLDGAAAAYQLAIDSEQREAAPSAAFNLGTLRHEQGDIDGAAAAFQLAIDSGHPQHAANARSALDGLRQAGSGREERIRKLRKAAADVARVAKNHPDREPVPSRNGSVPSRNGSCPPVRTGSGPPARAADPDFEFLSVEQGLRLRGLVREAFEADGLVVTESSDYLQVGDGAEYGLYNLAANCHAAPDGEADWPDLVREHVETMLAATTGPNPLETLSKAEILSRTYVRIYDRNTLPDGDGYTYGRPIVGDLVELLVLDSPSTVQLFHRAHLARFDLGALREAGLANLRREQIEGFEVVSDGSGATVHVVWSPSVYTASKLLVLPDLLRDLLNGAATPYGVLVSVPNRHQIAFHPIVDESILASLQLLAEITAESFSDDVGPVSPFVYWWRARSFSQLSRFGADGQIIIDVDDEFGNLIEGMVGSG